MLLLNRHAVPPIFPNHIQVHTDGESNLYTLPPGLIDYFSANLRLSLASVVAVWQASHLSHFTRQMLGIIPSALHRARRQYHVPEYVILSRHRRI